MANVRNYEEYRAEVLDRLGDDYTVEDLRNTERWRLRVLDMLSGGGSGGGGSSDFSTAEVEFKNQTTKSLTISCCCIIDNNMAFKFLLSAAHTQTYTVVLYKGSQFIDIPMGVELATATGDITVDQEDGTIIINGSGSVLLQA